MHEIANKRPGWVWIISVFSILFAVWSCISWYMVVSRGMYETYNTPETKTYFESLTAFDYGLTIVGALVTLSAAITLFLLRKGAYPLFCAAFIIALISVRPSALRTMQSVKGGILGYFLGMMALLAICLYTKQLRDQGRLR